MMPDPAPPSPLESGTYKPVDLDNGIDFFLGLSGATGGTALGIFNGTDPNGVWRLYLMDDALADGIVVSGWCLDIETAGSIPQKTADAIVAPSPALVGQVVSFGGFFSDRAALTITWDFGDGESGSGMSATHTYENAGTYAGAATASNGQNVTKQTFSLTVSDAPTSMTAAPTGQTMTPAPSGETMTLATKSGCGCADTPMPSIAYVLLAVGVVLLRRRRAVCFRSF